LGYFKATNFAFRTVNLKGFALRRSNKIPSADGAALKNASNNRRKSLKSKSVALHCNVWQRGATLRAALQSNRIELNRTEPHALDLNGTEIPQILR
jgi:hypothetical protein